MAFITVNGVVLPTPTDFSCGVMDLSKAERNANGLMIIERIATKRKLVLSWAYATEADVKTILGAVSATFYDVTYEDPQTGAQRTGSFYCGDRNVAMISYDSNTGVARYKDLAFDLIER